MFGAAHAGDARGTRQPTRLVRQPPRVARGHDEARDGDRPRRTRGDTGRVAAGAAVAGRGRGRQLAIDDHQRAIRPPRAEHGVNLQAERPGTAETSCATEPLKRNQRRRCGEREIRRVRDRQRRQRAGDRGVDDARGEAIERVRRAVASPRAPRARSDRKMSVRPSRRRARRARPATADSAARRASRARTRRRTPPAPAASGR